MNERFGRLLLPGLSAALLALGPASVATGAPVNPPSEPAVATTAATIALEPVPGDPVPGESLRGQPVPNEPLSTKPSPSGFGPINPGGKPATTKPLPADAQRLPASSPTAAAPTRGGDRQATPADQSGETGRIPSRAATPTTGTQDADDATSAPDQAPATTPRDPSVRVPGATPEPETTVRSGTDQTVLTGTTPPATEGQAVEGPAPQASADDFGGTSAEEQPPAVASRIGGSLAQTGGPQPFLALAGLAVAALTGRALVGTRSRRRRK